MLEGQNVEHSESHDDSTEGTVEHGHAAHESHLSKEALIAHAQDGTSFHFPRFLGDHGHVEIKQLPFVELDAGHEQHNALTLQPLDFKITKFMVIEVIAAIIIVAIFVRLGKQIRSGGPPKGKFWNFFEVILVYIRDEVARPAIGKKDANAYMPFLWTIFFFVLGCNLMGMIPWMGSPTGALAVTGVLALTTFGVVLASGISRLGMGGFLKAQVPHMELPFFIAIVLVPMIFVIEIFGLVVKHFVLAVRLLANMFAGHVVLAVMLAFIAEVAGTSLFWFVTPASMGAATALSLLEVFVAFLQAYIFTFLSALFIGSAIHPH